MSWSWRRRAGAPTALCAALACLFGVAAAPAAGAAAATPGVEVGKVRLAEPDGGSAALLVPVRYPIQLAGHVVETRVRLVGAGGKTAHAWTLHERLSSGPVRHPERRRSFTFVHRIGLKPSLARRVRGGLGVRVTALGLLDANGDGKLELSSSDGRAQPLAGMASEGLCSTAPQVRVRPGRRVSLPLPICGGEVRWGIQQRPQHGTARIRHGRLVYRSAKRFRGTDSIVLAANSAGPSSSGADEPALPVPAPVQVTVGSGGGAVVRALGDSVTAGFGYYDDGSSMTLGSLLECRPGVKPYNDACSSNSTNTDNEDGKLAYAPDYGLANNVSWAAQWANEHGITNYENLAVSGSEPSDWAPGGDLHETTTRIESEKPDYLLITIGANPLLSEMLFGVDNMGCAIYAAIFGGYAECVEEAFAEVHLRRELKSLYTDLVEHTQATIFLMQYPLSIPSTALAYSATQIAEMGKLLNREIASVAAEVSRTRLQAIAPPHFNVGVDISPVYPSKYSCSRFGYKVDGPSVQTEASQDELELLHPLSFCAGPVPKGPEWVISGDTGIHPSATGYAQMASQLPAPSGS
jgi:lysophospholipase L1-like esterase